VVVSLGASVAQAPPPFTSCSTPKWGAVLVVDAAGLLVGIFSERDLLNKVAGLQTPLNQLAVDQFMTPRPDTVTADDTLAFALHKLDMGGLSAPTGGRGWKNRWGFCRCAS